MTPMTPTVATGPFRAVESQSPGVWRVLDARGGVFATVWGEHAHHDAPILAAALNEREAAGRLLDQAERIQDLEDQISDLESNLTDAERTIEDLQIELDDALS